MRNEQRTVLLLTGGILLPAAFFFSVTADLPHVLLLTLALLAGEFWWGKFFRPGDRTIIYSALSVAVLTVLFNYLFPLKNGRFGFLSFFLRPALLVPALLYAAALAANFARNRWRFGVAGAAGLGALTCGSDLQLARIPEFERLIGGEALLAVFPWFFGVSIALTLGGFLLALRYDRGAPGGNWRKRGVLALALLLIGGLMAGLFALYRRHEPEIRKLELALLRIGFRQLLRPAGGRTVFGREVDLNTTLRPEIRSDTRRIVFRVVGPSAPGYLRGRVFVRYDDGIWRNPDDTPRTLGGLLGEGVRADRYFSLDGGESRPPVTFEIFASPVLQTSLLFIPGAATGLELIAEELSVSPDGMIEASEFLREGGVSSFQAQPGPEGAGQLALEPVSERYLAVPESLRNPLQEVAREALTGREAADQEVFRSFLNFFHRRFHYSLEPDPDREGDPVAHFLRRSRRGHCELFASALTLLLREQGIPARYVTGFLCEERHPLGVYYLARLGNAHAWVEAYDRQQQRWVLLEPTPPGSALEPASWGDDLETWSDCGSLWLQQLLSDLRRGRYAMAVINTLRLFGSALWTLVADPLRGGGLALLLVLLIGWFRRRRHRRRETLDPAAEELRRLFREYRRFRRIRTEWTARQLELRGYDPEFLKHYQELRYRAEPPTPAELAALTAELALLRRQQKTK